MTRDYVRSGSRPAARKRKASGRNSRPAPRAPFPVFRALLALALVVGFGAFLLIIKGKSGEPKSVAQTPTATKPVPIEDQRPAKEKFDYMTLLENKQVNVDLPPGTEPKDFSVDPEQQKAILAEEQKKLALLKAQQRGQLGDQDGDGEDAQGVAPSTALSTTTTGQVPPTASRPATPARPVVTPRPVVPRNESERAAATLNGQPIASVPKRPATATTPHDSTVRDSNVRDNSVRDSSVRDGNNEAARAAALLAGTSLPPASTPATAAKPAPATTATGNTAAPVGRSYMMQCGAFRTNDQATSMRLRLSGAGHAAQVSQGQVNGATWYRVVVGPFASKADAEGQRASMQSRHLVDNCTIWLR